MVKSRSHIKLLCIYLSIAVILYASGCGEKASSLPSPDQTVTGSFSENGLRVDLTESVGLQNFPESGWKDVPILTLDFAQKIPLAISYDGYLLWKEWSKEDEEKGMENDALVIYNIKTGARDTIATVKYPAQITEAWINDNWIVWFQYLYGDGYGDGSCAIYSYDRNTKDTKLCFKSDSKDKNDAVSFLKSPTPSLKGNTLLLDILSGVSNSGQISNVCYEYNLVTGEKQEIAKQILCPEFEEDYIIGLGQDESNTEKSYSIIFKIKNNIITPLMDKGMYIYEYSTDGHGSALYVAQAFGTSDIANAKHTRDLYLLENGKSTLLKAQDISNESYGCSWPSISARAAMWRSDNCPYAYDRLLKKVIRLSNDKQLTSSFFTNDRYIVWTYRSEKNIEANNINTDLLNIIDTKDLPIR